MLKILGFCDSSSSSDMAHSLTSLAVFQSVIRKGKSKNTDQNLESGRIGSGRVENGFYLCVGSNAEMMRSLHVYGSVEIEREFLFDSKRHYVEKKTEPLFRSEGFWRPEISEGSVFGTWRCIFVFRFNHSLPRFPTLLCISR